ncbi:oligosaccharide flippase family protein, partial [Pediococcus acidilactici]|uniref:oligosaccharide flippase family protein n=1 Tax=Pediococcus acidilactici TaxID=1254 RepID=UPI000AB295FB
MRIVKNFLFNVSYQVFILLVPLVTTPYISRVLGSEGVGINAYTNSIIQYFILFGTIGINTYGNRQIAYSRGNNKVLVKN